MVTTSDEEVLILPDIIFSFKDKQFNADLGNINPSRKLKKESWNIILFLKSSKTHQIAQNDSSLGNTPYENTQIVLNTQKVPNMCSM